MMRKAKVFTIIAVLTLAIGIGANTAIFSVIYGVLIRPLPYEDSGRLVHIWHTPPQASFPGMKTFAVSPANYIDWRAQSQSFQDMGVAEYRLLNLSGAGEPVAMRGWGVSSNYFSALRLKPMLGRTFAPDEDQPGKEHVILLSYTTWKTRFGADPGIVGRTVNMDEVPYTVIGVLPKGTEYPERAEFFVPVAWTPAERSVRGAHDAFVVARLRDGVDIKAAQSEMNTISKRLEEAYPVDDKGWGAVIVPLQEDMVGDVRPALLVLLGAVVFVLLIACVNVANLMLAKILDRRKEIAVRNALGASRRRILEQVLAESVLLAFVGGILGAVLAVFGVQAIVTYLSDQLPRVAAIKVDVWVLLFTLVVSIGAGLITGVAPAWRLSNVNVSDALKRGAGRGAETGGRRIRSVLVVAEVALSLMLLAGAGLLLRSLWKLQGVDPGFDPKNVLAANLSVQEKLYNTAEKTAQFYSQVMQQVKAIPGVQSAAAIDSLPLSGGSMQPFAIEGYPAAAMADQPELATRRATADYFRTMGIRVLKGREFSESDAPDRPRVIIVSESMAKRFWPNQDPIGKHLTQTFMQGGPREVIGVVADVKMSSLSAREEQPTVYVPASQLDAAAAQYGGTFRAPGLTLVVRTSTKPTSVIMAVNNAVHQINADIPVTNVQTMEEYMADTLAPQKFNFFLLGTFAALALLLATLGIYSVLAYSVRRRTQEIGIRMAMGAQIKDVLRLVLGEGMGLVFVGIFSGLLGALVLSRFLQSLLFSVGQYDVLTFVSVAGLLALVALGACYLPARRAMRVDPVIALREE